MPLRVSLRRSAVFFDVDGTLFDTRPLVTAAYRRVGIEPPSDTWGKSWREWLPGVLGVDERTAGDTHAAKNAVYVELLRDTPPTRLAPYDTACALVRGNEYDVAIISAASRAAVVALLAGTPLTRLPLATELSRRQLHGELGRVLSHVPCALIDDDEERLTDLKLECGEHTEMFHPVLFTGVETAAALGDRIRRAVPRVGAHRAPRGWLG